MENIFVTVFWKLVNVPSSREGRYRYKPPLLYSIGKHQKGFDIQMIENNTVRLRSVLKWDQIRQCSYCFRVTKVVKWNKVTGGNLVNACVHLNTRSQSKNYRGCMSPSIKVNDKIKPWKICSFPNPQNLWMWPNLGKKRVL